jgi:hypothetical protein
MDSELKDALLKTNLPKTDTLLIETKLNNLFYTDDENREDRVMLHGSGLVASDSEWCYRQAILSFYYKGSEPKIPIGLKRIFLNGWYVHEKWQKMFMQAGIAVGVEQRGESEEWGLLYTPDAIIKLGTKLYVVEIKSVNTMQFNNMISHPHGEKQLQLYMHMSGIPHGFVLCEDKNNQNIKIFPYEYDSEKARPYVERMVKVKALRKKFEEEGTLPMRCCDKESCKRSLGCAYHDACWNIKREKIKVGSFTGSGATTATVKQK